MLLSKLSTSSNRIYYGWWIVLATFLNLFFAVGIIFYGFPVLYPYFIESLAFTRAQVTQGFFLGFLFAGLPIGVLAGAFHTTAISGDTACRDRRLAQAGPSALMVT